MACTGRWKAPLGHVATWARKRFVSSIGGWRSLISPSLKRVVQQVHLAVFRLLRVLTDLLLHTRPYQTRRSLAVEMTGYRFSRTPISSAEKLKMFRISEMAMAKCKEPDDLEY